LLFVLYLEPCFELLFVELLELELLLLLLSDVLLYISIKSSCFLEELPSEAILDSYASIFLDWSIEDLTIASDTGRLKNSNSELPTEAVLPRSYLL